MRKVLLLLLAFMAVNASVNAQILRADELEKYAKEKYGENISIAILPGFGKAKHFCSYGVIDNKKVVCLVMVFVENRVIGKKLIDSVAYLVPFT